MLTAIITLFTTIKYTKLMLREPLIMMMQQHATNSKPLDLSITKSVVSMMFVFLIMFFLFKNLADSYAKEWWNCSGRWALFRTHRFICKR